MNRWLAIMLVAFACGDTKLEPDKSAVMLTPNVAFIVLREGVGSTVSSPDDCVLLRVHERNAKGQQKTMDRYYSCVSELKPSWQVVLHGMRVGEQRRCWIRDAKDWVRYDLDLLSVSRPTT